MTEYKGASMEGARAMALTKQRERDREELEYQKRKMETDNTRRVTDISSKFSATVDSVEQILKAETVGLVTLDQFAAKRQRAEMEREKQVVAANIARSEKEEALKRQKATDAKARTAAKCTLSFDLDDEEEADEEEATNQQDQEETDEQKRKRQRFGMNPAVDTNFLPDRDREELERQQREQLRQQWVEQQERMKAEDIEVVFSYWDGSGHRYSVKVKKGDTIEQFLQKALDKIRGDFIELRNVSMDSLMYIKEDLIIPSHFTFYEFIINKARGKSGPLFSFDVHEDIRLMSDVRVEKDESHAGKVLLRSWYERNKHIFPASRWEPYDPEKQFSKYTIC